ncbi:MAG: hypothetical protein M3N28_05020 [Actinomycetota bacterium]|nr:hypothetical protein [Actinomycetota bacterium]
MVQVLWWAALSGVVAASAGVAGLSPLPAASVLAVGAAAAQWPVGTGPPGRSRV